MFIRFYTCLKIDKIILRKPYDQRWANAVRAGLSELGPGIVRVVRRAKSDTGGTIFSRTTMICTYLDSFYQGEQLSTQIIFQ